MQHIFEYFKPIVSNIISIDFYVGFVASLGATLTILLLTKIITLIKENKKADAHKLFFGNWYLYRLTKLDSDTLELKLLIKKSIWKGVICKFSSPYVKPGEDWGRVIINQDTISCLFESKLVYPLLIVLGNYSQTDIADYKLGTMAGTTTSTGSAYCAKILLSRKQLVNEEVKEHLNKFSIILVTQDQSVKELVKFKKKINKFNTLQHSKNKRGHM